MLIEGLKLLLADETRRIELSAFMDSLYREIDSRIGMVQGTCDNCKRCCDFALSGLNLFVTNVELACFLLHTDQIPEITGARCPFLDDRAGCSARAARPIGCRTFFCKPPAGYDQQILYEEALSAVKQFVRERDLPYFYVEWIRTLKTLPEGGSSWITG